MTPRAIKHPIPSDPAGLSSSRKRKHLQYCMLYVGNWALLSLISPATLQNKCHATRNKCIATSNKCLTSSNKKLVQTKNSSFSSISLCTFHNKVSGNSSWLLQFPCYPSAKDFPRDVPKMLPAALILAAPAMTICNLASALLPLLPLLSHLPIL